MKTSSKIKSVFVILFVFFVTDQTWAQKSKPVKTALIQTTIYCDHCKQCETCGDKFHKDFIYEKGIKNVVIDEKAMTISVTYDSRKIDLDRIKTLISKLGYDADDVKADPAAVAKLDACCKKP